MKLREQGQMTEKDIEQLAVQVLEQSILDIDAATLSRLNRARQRALDSQARPVFWRGRLPVTAAACATLALAITLPVSMQQVAQPTDDSLIMPTLMGDVSLAALEDTELLENLDMMLWLVEEENHAS